MRYSTTLILALVVLVAAALVYKFRDQLTGEPKPPEKAPTSHVLMADLAAADVTKATLQQADGDKMKTRLALAKEGGQWRLTAPIAAAAEEFEVSRLLRSVLEGRYRQSVDIGAAKGQAELKTVGLDPPAYRLTLEATATGTAAARTVVLDIGQKTALGEGLFVRLGDAKKVIVLENSDLLKQVSDRIDTFRSRELVSVQHDDLVRIDLENDKGKVRLDRAALSEPPARGEPGQEQWVLAQPLAARADSELMAKIVPAALGARITNFVDDAPADLGTYGLVKPRLTVTLYKTATSTAAAEPVKAAVLRFGGWTDPKHEAVFVQLEGSPSVYSTAAQAFTDMNKSAADLRDKRVVRFDAAHATEVTLRIPAKLPADGKEIAYQLVKVDGAWKVKTEGRPDAKADPAAVDGLMKEIAGLRVLYYLEPGHESLAKGFNSQGSVKIQLEKDSAPVGFEFGGPPGDTPALVKNLREDWIGRINEKGLTWLRKGWLDLLDKQVLTVDAAKVTGLAIESPDRKLEFAKTADGWALAKPMSAETQPAFVEGLLEQLQDVKVVRFLPIAAEPKVYNLDPGLLVVRLTTDEKKAPDSTATDTKAAAAATATGTTTVLRLAKDEKGKYVGRIDGNNLLFEVAPDLFKALAAEPLAPAVVDLGPASKVTGLEATVGAVTVRAVKIDAKWFRTDAAGNPGDELASEAIEDVVRSAMTLKAARWVDYAAKDPAACGLDKPAARIKVIAGDTSATVLLSDKEVPPALAGQFEERPLRFAMTEGGPRIALIMGHAVDSFLGAVKAMEPKKDEPKAGNVKPAETKATDTKASELKMPDDGKGF